MIKFMKSWCEGIIIAILISIIIELIVPEGSNKKYIKVVVGIYIIFIVLSPILEKINVEYNIENIFQMESIEVSADLNENIKDVYVTGIEDSIKKELQEKGYIIQSVDVKVDMNYENIKKIEIQLLEQKDNKKEIQIDPVIINENEKEQNQYSDLKKDISENYQVSIEQIYIY